jgi:hypothetical protein
MADEAQRLLYYIVEHYTGREEVKDVERSATTAEAVQEIEAEQRRVMRKERALADRMVRPFLRGLAKAYAAYCAGGNAITLDDRNAEENLMAEALIHFLVGPGLASSMSRETEPMHYLYIISVHWDKLAELARKAQVDLEAMLKLAMR